MVVRTDNQSVPKIHIWLSVTNFWLSWTTGQPLLRTLDSPVINICFTCAPIVMPPNLLPPAVLIHTVINPWSTELRNLNFQPLEVVQVPKNLCDLRNLSPNIYQCFKIESIIYFKQLVMQELVKSQNVYCNQHQCAKGY